MSVTPAPLAPLQIHYANQDRDDYWKQVGDNVQKFCDQIAQARPVVYSTASAIVIASAGTALPAMTACCAAYEATILLAPKLVEWYNEVNQWIWAPFNFLDMSDGLQPAYDHATNCKQALIREAMPADREWEGDSVDAYYAHIAKHNAASGDAEAVIRDTKKAIHSFGVSATVATIAALAALIQAVIEAILGIIALIPPATPVGAGVIAVAVTLFGATIAALVAFAKMAVEALETLKSDTDGKLRSNNFPGGKWPQATSHAVRSDIEDIGGWSYE